VAPLLRRHGLISEVAPLPGSGPYRRFAGKEPLPDLVPEGGAGNAAGSDAAARSADRGAGAEQLSLLP
jgi:hypothetical protein